MYSSQQSLTCEFPYVHVVWSSLRRMSKWGDDLVHTCIWKKDYMHSTRYGTEANVHYSTADNNNHVHDVASR